MQLAQQSRVKRDNSNKETMNVLIAEDDLFQRAAIVDYLQLCNFQVIACKNGLEARDELLKSLKTENEFDVILLDLVMPEMGGLDLLKIIKSIDKFKETPVIMMSGENETDIVAACLNAGATNYFVKPIKFNQYRSLQEIVKKKPKKNNNTNEKGFYEVIKNLGRGAFGSVQLVQKSTDQEYYAMKIIPTAYMNEQEKSNAVNEVSLLKVLTAPTIIKYYESFTENEQLNIIMEYAEGGSLSEKIAEYIKSGQKIPKDQILSWMAQLVIAIHFMHSKNILHRDIKTQNMFLSKDQIIKLGDFGISKALGTHGNFAQTFLGTPYFMPPEVIRGEPYGKKADIWALGCALYELVMLKRPFQHDVMQIVFDMIQNKPYEMDPTVDSELQMLIEKTLQKDPNKRPFVQDLANVPCIKEKINQFYAEHPKESTLFSKIANQIFFQKHQLINNEDNLLENSEDNRLKLVIEMIQKLPYNKFINGIFNLIEYTAVSGQDIINFLKTNFEKKNEKEIIEFAQTLLETQLIISTNQSQQFLISNYYQFPLFLDNIPANNYQLYTGNSQDIQFILKKLIRKFRDFSRKLVQNRQLDLKNLDGNFTEYFQVMMQTQELQKATMIDYSQQKKIAVFINIYQLMRFHKSLQTYYIDKLLKQQQKQEHIPLLKKFIGYLLPPRKINQEFSYLINGQIITYDQIKHKILRNQKTNTRNNQNEQKSLQLDILGIFVLFIEEYEDPYCEIIQQPIFLDEGSVLPYVQKLIQTFIEQNTILDEEESEIVIHPLFQTYLCDFGSQRKLLEWILDYKADGQTKMKILNKFKSQEFFILFKDPNILQKY